MQPIATDRIDGRLGNALDDLDDPGFKLRERASIRSRERRELARCLEIPANVGNEVDLLHPVPLKHGPSPPIFAFDDRDRLQP